MIDFEKINKDTMSDLINSTKHAVEYPEYCPPTIIFDIETTGLNPEEDEILEISIIDRRETVVFHSFIKPYHHKEWPSAYEINHISYEMVENAPFLHQVMPIIRGIFEKAEMLVGYNLCFDISFLAKWGVYTSDKEQYDVMLGFAEEYGEWSEQHGRYKWKKLVFAAEYYGYHFTAHDSLEDAKATLFVCKKMEDRILSS